MRTKGSKYPLEAGASKKRPVDPDAINPFVVNHKPTTISSELYDYLTCKLNLPPKDIEKLKGLLNAENVFSSNVARETNIKWPPPPEEWLEEFEDEMVNSHGNLVIENGFEYCDERFLETYFKSGDKVKIKCKDGLIQIERI